MENVTNVEEPAGAASGLSAELEDMIQQAERKAFEQWYAENAFDYVRDPIGSKLCADQWAAWKARASMQSKCRGVARPGCDYLAPCGMVCDKCAREH